MTAAGWALQKAIHAALAGDAGVRALIGDPPRLHDAPPRTGAFPFVAFGDAREAKIPGTDDLREHDFRLAIHSRYEGRREVTDIAEAIVAALDDAPLILDGFRLVSLSASATDIFHREGADAHQGLVRLRAVTERLL